MPMGFVVLLGFAYSIFLEMKQLVIYIGYYSWIKCREIQYFREHSSMASHPSNRHSPWWAVLLPRSLRARTLTSLLAPESSLPQGGWGGESGTQRTQLHFQVIFQYLFYSKVQLLNEYLYPYQPCFMVISLGRPWIKTTFLTTFFIQCYIIK